MRGWGRSYAYPAVIVLVILASTIPALHTPIEKPRLDAKEYARLLGVGLAVDWLNYRWVEYYYFYWRAKGVSIPLILRREGFRHVRIRIGKDLAGNETALEELKTIIRDCLEAGLIPVVGYTARELRSDPENPRVQQDFIRWWTGVAEALRNEPSIVAFDLIVETSGSLRDKYSLLNHLYREVIRRIRSIDPYRIIIVTPPDTSSPFSAEKLDIAFDDYMVLEWHIYAGGPKKKDGIFYNKTLVEKAIEHILDWSREKKVPVYMGAWRPNRYPKHTSQRLPDGAPRPLYPVKVALEFSEYMARILCSHHIPFAVNADTLFIDYRKPGWYPSQKPVIDRIIGVCRNAFPGSLGG